MVVYITKWVTTQGAVMTSQYTSKENGSIRAHRANNWGSVYLAPSDWRDTLEGAEKQYQEEIAKKIAGHKRSIARLEKLSNTPMKVTEWET